MRRPTPADDLKMTGSTADRAGRRCSTPPILAAWRIDGAAYTAVGYSFSGLGVSPDMETIYRNLPTLLRPHLKLIFAKLLSA